MKSTLLLLHGALGGKSQLESLKKILENDYEIHLLNFEGHGDKISDNEFSIELFAKNLLDYLNQNQLEKVNVFGYSMGGYVALHLATQHPNRFEKIITLGTKFKWNPEEATKETRMLNPEKIEEKVPAFANYLNQLHTAQSWKINMQKTAAMIMNLGNGANMKDTDFSTITSKCFIGVGDSDTMVTAEETQYIAEIIPNAEFYLLENTIHPIDKIDFEKVAFQICALATSN